ncbi:hypothetical protein [Ferrovibrio sp.]|uniref:hypothetical protein n=1 Tax=Ferrovibrio sp. TaxID=1917215 RepID=UPI0025BBEAA3|nr:hypothetical protein [Ferrovibrio sp.]MBX3454354.1 hypothetical protein [Ferrovibrio sp.]
MYEKNLLPSIFDDPYFEVLAKRRDEKRAATNKIIASNVVLLLLLALVAFGVKPDISFQGVHIEVDKLKELLLFLHTAGSFTGCLLFNDLMVMREMLKSRIQLRLDKYEDLPSPLLKAHALQALDMRYLDSLGDYTPIHFDSLGKEQPFGIQMRGVIVRKTLIVIMRMILIFMFGIQIAVLYDVAMHPSFHWAISWSVVVLSALTSFLWLLVKLPYIERKEPNEQAIA